MPHITLIIDAAEYRISSSDPEMIGKWLYQTFVSTQPTKASYVQFRADPMWLVTPEDRCGVPDWSADARLMMFHQIASEAGPLGYMKVIMACISDVINSAEVLMERDRMERDN